LRGCAVARLLSGETLMLTNPFIPLSRHLKEQRKLCQDYFSAANGKKNFVPIREIRVLIFA
jgi:hypothetical protein